MIRRSTRLLLTLVLAGPLGLDAAFPQDLDTTGRGSTRLGVSAGITSFSLGELRDLTDQVVSTYKAFGLPVELDREYPPNLLVNAEGTFVGLEPWAFGISGSYTWTSAYILYADYAGTLEFHTKVQVLSGYLIAQYSFTAGQALQPFVDIRGGVSLISLSIKETIEATEFVDAMVTSEISGDQVGFGGEAAAGIRYSFGSLALTGRLGYRYANASEMKVDITGAGQGQGSGNLAFDINASGFLGLLTLEVTL